MDDSKEDFCRHLSDLGFEIGAPREWVQQKFRRRVGEERFAQFQKLIAAPADDPEKHNRIYDFVQTTAEANLLRSIDPDVTVATSYSLYEACRTKLRPGMRVLELGCWTGGLDSFIAKNHPQCQVTGVDRVERIIELNRQTHRLPNLAFHKWDYRWVKPPEVARADLLLCGLGINNPPTGGYTENKLIPLRESAGYLDDRPVFDAYFRNWRSAARDGATLLAVLRIVTFGRFLILLDAARDAGWTAEPRGFGSIIIPSAKEHLPILTFIAKPSELMSEDLALTHFVPLATRGDPYIKVSSGLALAMYQGLKDKHVLHSAPGKNELGWPMFVEAGIAGAVGYVFSRDIRPDYVLSIVSVPQVTALAQKAIEEGKLQRSHAEGFAVKNSKPVSPAALENSFFTSISNPSVGTLNVTKPISCAGSTEGPCS